MWLLLCRASPAYLTLVFPSVLGKLLLAPQDPPAPAPGPSPTWSNKDAPSLPEPDSGSLSLCVLPSPETCWGSFILSGPTPLPLCSLQLLPTPTPTSCRVCLAPQLWTPLPKSVPYFTISHFLSHSKSRRTWYPT